MPYSTSSPAHSRLRWWSLKGFRVVLLPLRLPRSRAGPISLSSFPARLILPAGLAAEREQREKAFEEAVTANFETEIATKVAEAVEARLEGEIVVTQREVSALQEILAEKLAQLESVVDSVGSVQQASADPRQLAQEELDRLNAQIATLQEDVGLIKGEVRGMQASLCAHKGQTRVSRIRHATIQGGVGGDLEATSMPRPYAQRIAVGYLEAAYQGSVNCAGRRSPRCKSSATQDISSYEGRGGRRGHLSDTTFSAENARAGSTAFKRVSEHPTRGKCTKDGQTRRV